MAKDRDWVDYANLASNIAQNVQLGDIQHKLGAVASAIQEEKDKAEREHRLREAVFQAEGMLRTLQKSSKDNPRASLAWTRNNLLQFQRNDVTSASFRSYEDRERLRSVVEGHEQLIQECAAGLLPQQQDQAERCGQYLMERDDLNLLIRLVPEWEKLDRLKVQVAPLQAKDKKFGLLQGAGVALLLLGMFLFANEHRIPSFFVMGTGLMLCLASFAVSPKHERKAEIEKEIARLVRNEPLLDPVFNLVKTLGKQFGHPSSDELLQMRNDREALIAEVLGEAKPPANV